MIKMQIILACALNVTQDTEVDKIVTRKGGLNCDPLKIILKLKKQFSSSLLGSVKLIF